MKIKKSLAALTATVSIMALATGCSSSGSSGVVDTQADKGLAVMGDTITYDPNHLVNDGQPIELGYWSWGDESTDPVISMLHEYEKIHPNVTFKISQVAWSDYWVKTPLSLKGNKNAPVLFNVHNSEDALLRPHAVRLDGASDWLILRRIAIPLIKPTLAVVTMYYAIGPWNDFMTPLIYINKESLQPMQLLLRRILAQFSTDFTQGMNIMAALKSVVSVQIRYVTIVVAIAPILLVYPFIQKYFTKGVMIGAVKE